MILIFGRTGQVATELHLQADMRALGRDRLDMRALGRDQADLSDPAACAAAIAAQADQGLTGVINAAAFTAVDRAEDDAAQAQIVNATAPGAMAQACAALDVPFVHISTDYVFDGQGTAPFAPDAPTAPLGVYGQTKLAGEEAVRAAGGPHAILRTSWVFSAHGANFLKTMLRLSETRDHLRVVADQIGGPTPAAAIAAATVQILTQLSTDPAKSGTYHFSGAPDVSWAEFARTIFTAAGRSVTVEDIPTSAYPTPAARPLNSRLDCATLETEFGITRPDWKQAVTAIVDQLT